VTNSNPPPQQRRILAPPIDLRLIEWLRGVFPNTPAHPSKVTTDNLWFNQGCQAVIARLQHECDDQSKNVLEETK
jgi:hypothetical protein